MSVSLGSAIRAYAKQNKIDRYEIFRQVTFILASGIVEVSTVDTGRFRSNWIMTSNQASNRKIRSTSRNPLTNHRTIVNEVLKKSGTFFFVNNLPQGRVLEYGLYPKNPKRGSKIRGSRPARYEKRSINGFSTQTRKGMIRLNIRRLKRDFLKIAKSDKIKTAGSGKRVWTKNN